MVIFNYREQIMEGHCFCWGNIFCEGNVVSFMEYIIKLMTLPYTIFRYNAIRFTFTHRLLIGWIYCIWALDGSIQKRKCNSHGLVPKLSSTDNLMATDSIPKETYVSYFRSINKPLLISAMVASYMTVYGAQFHEQLIVARWTKISRCDNFK